MRSSRRPDRDAHHHARRPEASGRRDASRRYHDRVARQYDSIYDDAYWAFHDELTWRLIKPYLPHDASAACADLGCGTGKWGLRLLKSGFNTTFVDHSAAMIEQTRRKTEAMGPRSKRATLLVADIIDLSAIASERFALITAMGDVLSICSDPPAAAREMHRLCAPGGVVIATADNKLAALDHFMQQGNLDALESFVRTGRTHWLTPDEREQFELTMFTPVSLRKLFEQAGFHVLSIVGKPVLPIRAYKTLLETEGAAERLLRLEVDLSKDPSASAKSAHLQIAAKRAE
jgi:ubiquinone/menaquinone biosynthesis C-methylase UbiE